MSYYECPTCGDRGYVRARKGGILRVLGINKMDPNKPGYRNTFSSIRVYWPTSRDRSGLYGYCPNPYHEKQRRYYAPPAPTEETTSINLRLDKKELAKKHKLKAKKHKDFQSKEKR